MLFCCSDVVSRGTRAWCMLRCLGFLQPVASLLLLNGGYSWSISHRAARMPTFSAFSGGNLLISAFDFRPVGFLSESIIICPCGKIISIQMRRDPASEPQSQEKMCSGKLIGWMENKWWAFKSIRRVLLSWSRFVSFLGESRKMEGRVAGAETTAWQTVAYLKVHVWTACIDNSFGLLCFAILRLSLSCSLKVNMSFYHRRCLQGTLLLLTKWWKVQLFGQLTKE